MKKSQAERVNYYKYEMVADVLVRMKHRLQQKKRSTESMGNVSGRIMKHKCLMRHLKSSQELPRKKPWQITAFAF
jgi:hypothetical protein